MPKGDAFAYLDTEDCKRCRYCGGCGVWKEPHLYGPDTIEVCPECKGAGCVDAEGRPIR